jgi:hypothetical protein
LPDPELRQIRDTLANMASEITTIYDGWPTLLRTLGEISRRLEEHERRIIRLEANAFLPVKPIQKQLLQHQSSSNSEWDLGEVSDTGTHRLLTHSEFDRLKMKDKLISFEKLKTHAGKIAAHVITIIITGTLALIWHYLKEGK